MADIEIKTPDCPSCGKPPPLTFATPYFCGNDDCDVVYWPPHLTLAEIRAQEPVVMNIDSELKWEPVDDNKG